MESKWLVCGVFMTVVSLAVAEIGSIDHAAGGMYHSILASSSSKRKRLLAWIVGCRGTFFEENYLDFTYYLQMQVPSEISPASPQYPGLVLCR